MPWFQNSKQKQLRVLVEDKMRQCLTKPERYQEAVRILDSFTRASNQKVIEMIIDHVKEIIKDEDVEPMRKYQSILMLRDLMKSHNKVLGKYVVKKILKRLTLFAQHRKVSKDEERGKDIFPQKKNKQQQSYGAKFLITLLLAIEDWGKNWPRSPDGPFRDFESAYNQLIMSGVQFPVEAKKDPANRLSIGKTVKQPPQNKISKPTTLINPPTNKQLVVPKKEKAPKYILDYLSQLIQCMKTFISIINQNPQFGQIWDIIKEVVKSLKNIVQEGDSLLAQLLSNGQQGSDIYQKIEDNQTFMSGLEKDINTVDNKSQKYPRFRSKYIKNINQKIASFQIYFSDRSNSQSKLQESSAGDLSRQRTKIINQPKVQEVQVPKVQAQKNRYDSTSHLQEQLKLGHIQINKQDFNSNHSQRNSNRFNSVGGTQVKTDSVQKQKQRQNNSDKKQNKIYQQQESSQEQKTTKNLKVTKKEQIDSFEKSKNMSKISEQNIQSEQGFGGFEVDIGKKSEAPSQIFNDFQIQSGANQHDNSNSDFFKEVDKKQGPGKVTDSGLIKRRDKPLKKKQEQNFFDQSVHHKAQSSGFSDFKKADESGRISKQKINRDSKPEQSLDKGQLQQGFDTFKQPNSIVNAVKQLRNQQSKFNNPFETQNVTQQNQNDNPFATSVKGQNEQDKFEESFNDDKKSKHSNPFSQKYSGSHNNSSVKEGFNNSNFSANKEQKEGNRQNPFDSRDQITQKSIDSGKTNKKGGNPFETSVMSNPFEKSVQHQNDRSLSKNNSFKNVKVEIEHSKQNFNVDDPFETKNQGSQKSYEKQNTSNQFNTKAQKVQNFLRESLQGGFNLQDFPNMSQTNKSQRNSLQKSKDYRNSKENESGFWDEGFSQQKADGGIKKDSLVINKQQKSVTNPDAIQKIKTERSQYGFDDFDSWDNKQKDNSKQIQAKQKTDMFSNFDYSNSEKHGEPKEKVQFSMSDFDKFQQQKLDHSRSSMKNPFQGFSGQKQNKQKYSEDQKSSKQKQKVLYGWQNFGNQFKDKSGSIAKGLDQSAYQNSEEGFKINQKKSQKSWGDFGKQNAIDNSSQSIKNMINSKSNSQKQQNQKKSIEKESLQKINLPLIDYSKEQVNYKQIPTQENNQMISHQKKSYYQQMQSPFQKKQQPWSFNISPGSQSAGFTSRYNPQNIEQILTFKQKEVEDHAKKHRGKLQKYNDLKNKYEQLRNAYKDEISNVSRARQQKDEFKTIYSNIKESNEKKQKQIEDLLKKTKKVKQIKQSILEKQKMLYQLIKHQRAHTNKAENMKQTANKWDRFNNNVKKIREQNQQQSNYQPKYKISGVHSMQRRQQQSIYY